MTRSAADSLIGRYPLSICIAIGMHFIWSIAIGIDPEAVDATAVHTMLSVPGINYALAAMIFGAVATMAAIGMVLRGTKARVLFILPQQMVLWFSFVGVTHAMWLGAFADGVVRSHWFLIVDQVPVVLITLGHTAALLLLASDGRGR
jgi:hypothetical protein